jgi:uncharacterized protein (DUF488 family)
MPELLTIGHSNHDAERFAALLSGAGIEVVADVRSWPHSRYAEWAGRERLPLWLREHGHNYVFLGRELGGRPVDGRCYDAAGHVLYGRVAASASFAEGIKRLEVWAGEHRAAILCSEEDPTHCHRRLLVAKVLMERGVRVTHIRGDGRLQPEPGVTAPDGMLFYDEDLWWRSTQSVSRKRRRSVSSAV